MRLKCRLQMAAILFPPKYVKLNRWIYGMD